MAPFQLVLLPPAVFCIFIAFFVEEYWIIFPLLGLKTLFIYPHLPGLLVEKKWRAKVIDNLSKILQNLVSKIPLCKIFISSLPCHVCFSSKSRFSKCRKTPRKANSADAEYTDSKNIDCSPLEIQHWCTKICNQSVAQHTFYLSLGKHWRNLPSEFKRAEPPPPPLRRITRKVTHKVGAGKHICHMTLMHNHNESQ